MFLFGSKTLSFFFAATFNILCLSEVHLDTQKTEPCFLKMHLVRAGEHACRNVWLHTQKGGDASCRLYSRDFALAQEIWASLCFGARV